MLQLVLMKLNLLHRHLLQILSHERHRHLGRHMDLQRIIGQDTQASSIVCLHFLVDSRIGSHVEADEAFRVPQVRDETDEDLRVQACVVEDDRLYSLVESDQLA